MNRELFGNKSRYTTGFQHLLQLGLLTQSYLQNTDVLCVSFICRTFQNQLFLDNLYGAAKRLQ